MKSLPILCSWRMQTEWSSDPPQYQVFMPTNAWLFIQCVITPICTWSNLISSSEGTTKGAGAPPTMPVYAIGIIPLLKIIKPKTPEDITMKHVAFAGELLELRRWWDTIDPWGPNVGT